jgi:hypothetical protein
MKTYLLLAVLVGTLLAAISFVQEFNEDEHTPAEAMEREIHMRNMQLELAEQEAQAEVGERMRQIELKKQHMALQQHEAEMDFNQKMREIELQKLRMNLKNQHQPQKHPPCCAHCRGAKMFPLLAICCIVHILVAVWVYQDIRRRNAGSGLWIVIALLTGLLGALVYAVVRLGDNRQTQS